MINIQNNIPFKSRVYLIDNANSYMKNSNPLTHPNVNQDTLKRVIDKFEKNGFDDVVTIKTDNDKLQLQVRKLKNNKVYTGISTIDKLTVNSALNAYEEAKENLTYVTKSKMAYYLI